MPCTYCTLSCYRTTWNYRLSFGLVRMIRPSSVRRVHPQLVYLKKIWGKFPCVIPDHADLFPHIFLCSFPSFRCLWLPYKELISMCIVLYTSRVHKRKSGLKRPQFKKGMFFSWVWLTLIWPTLSVHPRSNLFLRGYEHQGAWLFNQKLTQVQSKRILNAIFVYLASGCLINFEL